jgi:hypothetical protein
MVVMNKRRENVIDAYYDFLKILPKILFQTHLFGKKFWYKHSIVTER